MKTCSRQGYFELVSVNHSARSGGRIGINFSILMKVYFVFFTSDAVRDYNLWSCQSTQNMQSEIIIYGLVRVHTIYHFQFYLQGVTLNMLFVKSLIPKLIIYDILSKLLLLIKVWTLLIYRAFSEINRYNHPYQIISRTVKYQSFVINIINLLGALYLISINLFLILISRLVPLTLELARTLNMFIRLQVMLLRAI